jgi:hypothetical protein
MTSRSYELRVAGALPAGLTEAMGVAAITQEPARTVIVTGPADQAALLGLMDWLRLMGVELLEVRQLNEVVEPAPGDE